MATFVGIFKSEDDAERCLREFTGGSASAYIERQENDDQGVRLVVTVPDAAAGHVRNTLSRHGASDIHGGRLGGLGTELGDYQGENQ